MKITLTPKSKSIQYLCKKDKRLARVISMVGPITYVPHEDGFSFLVHEIIEQMLSVKAGAKIYGRLEDLCGGAVTAEAIRTLSDEELKGIGTSAAKAAAIRRMTDAVLSGKLDLKDLEEMSDAEVIRTLTAFRGIGLWTANMYLIFVLDRQDVLPAEDVAFLQAYEWMYKTKDRSRASVEKKCRKWKPYSSIAARYLYRALDMGLTKEEIHLYKTELIQQQEKDPLAWEEVHTEHIIQDEWIDFRRSSWRFPDGSELGPFYTYSRRDYVVIVASDTDGDYLCVRQFRQGIRQVTTEFPAGGIERKDGKEYGSIQDSSAEGALAAAKRELLEETGYESEEWEHLLTVPSNATIADNYAHLFAARNCRKVSEQDLDEMEFLNVIRLPAQKIEELIAQGEFQQAMHITAWLLAQKK